MRKTFYMNLVVFDGHVAHRSVAGVAACDMSAGPFATAQAAWRYVGENVETIDGKHVPVDGKWRRNKRTRGL